MTATITAAEEAGLGLAWALRAEAATQASSLTNGSAVDERRRGAHR
jgi:hypothetical protein